MILKDFIRRLRGTSGPKLNLLSKLMVDTTWSFFIAIIVFIIASYLLLPRMIYQERELQRLRMEIDALNGVLNPTRVGPDSDQVEDETETELSDDPVSAATGLPENGEFD